MAAAVAFRNGSPHNKLNILQESVNNVHNTKNKDDKQDNAAKRKPTVNINQKSISVTDLINNQSNMLIEAPKNRKPKTMKETGGKVHNPPPIAVARRNARERNRVRQVNNGFATLRQHIPNEIAEIYENANNNRATNKKLSKVETLRMAVEYIRSLENLLSLSDDNREYKENTTNISLSSFPSPASSESLQNGSSFEQSYFSMQSPVLEDEDDSSPATPLPSVTSHHYSRIPGTNNFQLIPATITYEDEENVHPLTPNSDMLHQDQEILIQPEVVSISMDSYGLSQQFAVIHPQIISPHVYSDSSLSPDQNVDFVDVKYVPHHPNLLTAQLGPSQLVYQSPLVLNPNLVSVVSSIPVEKCVDNRLFDGRLLHSAGDEMKQEPAEGNGQQDVDSDDMDDVINWWETEGRHEDESS